MRIGIDVDGVLTDIGTYQMKYGKRYFCDKRHRSIKNPKGYDIVDIFDCTYKEQKQFWLIYIWKYCMNETMTDQAAETVRGLHERGHEIYIVTSRIYTTQKGIKGTLSRWMLRYWLKKNHFYYDQLIFCSEKGAYNKYSACMDNNIDVLIDDKPENLFSLKNVINVICYPAVWNEDLEELHPYRIHSFNEVEDRINELTNNA